MVSTRGVKFKFCEGEKVLCYEPDPSKAKVLYDSKILEVVPKGRKSVEYLIHFQGWNSSWDRCVSEEFVLRDTEENRQLQKQLAEKSQLQLKERGQQRRTKHLSSSGKVEEDSDMDKALGLEMLDDDDVIVLSDDDDVVGEGMEEIMEEDEEGEEEEDIDSEDDNDDSEQDESEPEEEPDAVDMGPSTSKQYAEPKRDFVPLDMPDELKRLLELDDLRVNRQRLYLRLPATPTVHQILEEYVREYARELLGTDDESKADSDQEMPRGRQQSVRMQPPRKRQRRSSSTSSEGEEIDKELEMKIRSIRICTHVAHSLMTYIDFILGKQLLYISERLQFNEIECMARRRDLALVKDRHNPPPYPVQQRLLARIDSEVDSEDDGKSDTEAELLQMISAMDEGFAQRWNDLLRDAGCETDPETDPCKGGEVDELEEVARDVCTPLGTRAVYNPLSTSPAFVPLSDRGSGSRSTRGAANSTTICPASALKRTQIMEEVMDWKIVPEKFLKENDLTMSQIYGGVHLARLMVRMPYFLQKSNLKSFHIQTIQKHLNFFIRFLSKQCVEKDWFGEHHYYCDAPDPDEGL